MTSFSPARAETVHGIDDTKETISKFLDKIAVAKSLGEESIETTPDVIRHYNRNGLRGAEYFTYSDIKVYPVGKTEEIEELIGRSREDVLHAAAAAKLLENENLVDRVKAALIPNT